MVAVMEELWPKCPWHHIDLEWDPNRLGEEFFCPYAVCDYSRHDRSGE